MMGCVEKGEPERATPRLAGLAKWPAKQGGRIRPSFTGPWRPRHATNNRTLNLATHRKETSSMISRFEQQNHAPLQVAQESYDPAFLLDTLLARMHLKEDVELAKKLKMNERLLSKIRDRRLQISGSMLMLMQEATGISISELRVMLKDRRRTSRMAGVLKPAPARK
jgi:hypothetical protein